MISTQLEFFTEQIHAKELSCSNHSVHFKLIHDIISFRCTEGATEEADGMFEPIVELLLQYGADSDSAGISLLDEVTRNFRISNHLIRQHQILEFLEFGG